MLPLGSAKRSAAIVADRDRKQTPEPNREERRMIRYFAAALAACFVLSSGPAPAQDKITVFWNKAGGPIAR